MVHTIVKKYMVQLIPKFKKKYSVVDAIVQNIVLCDGCHKTRKIIVKLLSKCERIYSLVDHILCS